MIKEQKISIYLHIRFHSNVSKLFFHTMSRANLKQEISQFMKDHENNFYDLKDKQKSNKKFKMNISYLHTGKNNGLLWAGISNLF